MYTCELATTYVVYDDVSLTAYRRMTGQQLGGGFMQYDTIHES